MANQITKVSNTKIDSVEFDAQFKRYVLYFIYPNVLLPGQFVKRTLTLWHNRQRDEAPDKKTIEATQDALREATHDKNVTFNYPSNPDDPNDIVNWAKTHQNAPLYDIYQNGRYYQIGESSGNSLYGGSTFLKMWNAKDGAYDPSKNYVRLFDSLPNELQTAVRGLDTSNDALFASRTGNVYLTLDEVIDHVIFNRSNAYQAESKDMSRDEIIDNILRTGQMSKDATVLAILDRFKQLKASKKPYGFSTIVSMVGGMKAPLLKADDLVQNSVAQLLSNATRTTAVLYVKNPVTGYVHKASPLRMRATIRRNDPYLEFLSTDYSPIDINDFVANYSQIGGHEIVDLATKHGLVDEKTGQIKQGTVEDALKLLNALFSGRQITIQSMLSRQGNPNDIDKLGTYINGFGEIVGIPTIDPNTAETPAEEPTPAKTETPAPAAKPQDNSASVAAPKAAVKSNAMNPFADTNDNAPADKPAQADKPAAPQTDVPAPTDGDKPAEDNTQNPFEPDPDDFKPDKNPFDIK